MATNILAQGHNAPPTDADPLRERLDETHIDLVTRKRELLDAEQRLPLVVDEDSLSRVSDFARQVKGCIRGAEAAHKEEKAPFLAAGRTVDGWLSGIKSPLLELASRVERRVGAYLAAKEAEERKRREAEAKALAAQAKELAAAGDKAGAKEVRAEARDVRDDARHAKPADLVRTHTAMGGVATLKAPWVFEVKDLDQIDLNRLKPHFSAQHVEQAIRGFVRSGGRELTGVRIFQDRKASIR